MNSKTRSLRCLYFGFLIFFSTAGAQNVENLGPFTFTDGIPFGNAISEYTTHYTVQIVGLDYTPEGQRILIIWYDKGDAFNEYGRVRLVIPGHPTYDHTEWGIGSYLFPGVRFHEHILPYNVDIDLFVWVHGETWLGAPTCRIYIGSTQVDYGGGNAYYPADYTITFRISPPQSFAAQVRDDVNHELTWTTVEAPGTVTQTGRGDFDLYRNGVWLANVVPGDSDYEDLGLNIPGQIFSYGLRTNYTYWGASETGYAHALQLTNGTVHGDVLTASGNSGIGNINIFSRAIMDTFSHALQLNGNGGHVLIDPMTDFPNANMTISFWMNSDNTGTANRILTYEPHSGNTFRIFNNGGLSFGLGGGVLNSGISYSSGWHHVAVTRTAGGILELFLDGVSSFTGSLPGTIGSEGILVFGHDRSEPAAGSYNGLLDEIRLWTRVRSADEIRDDMNRLMRGNESGLEAYWGFRTGEVNWAGDYSENGRHHGLLVSASKSNDVPPLFHMARTDQVTGHFGLFNIYYGLGAGFTVFPDSVEDREFQPGSVPIPWIDRTSSSYTLPQPIRDVAAYAVRGRIWFETEDSCGVEGVAIYVDDVEAGETDEDGYFSADARSGNHTIRPVLFDHVFQPPSINMDIAGDTTGLFFEDRKLDTLFLTISGGQCRYDIGEAVFNISSTDCFSQQVTTESGQNFVILPAFPNLTVTLESLDGVPIGSYLQQNGGHIGLSQTVSLADGSQIVDFIYYAPPELVIENYPEPNHCGVTIFEQADNHTLHLRIIERYGDEWCLADSGLLQIQNNLSYGAARTEVNLDTTAEFDYSFMVGEPNINPGGQHPYQKLLNMTIMTRGGSDSFENWAIITGHRPREQTFVTVSPELPLFILRDPPGDMSYSFLSEQHQLSVATSFSALMENSVNIYAAFRTGFKFETGFLGFSTEAQFWGDVSASLEIGGSIQGQTEHRVTLSTTEEFQTSALHGVVGEKGDVFVGAAFSILYALTDVLDVDENCDVVLSKSIIYAPDSVATRYMYTAHHIETNIIPKLHFLRSFTSDADSAQYYADQIEVWEQTLALNDSLKNEASDGQRYEFNGGGQPYRLTNEGTISDFRSIDFNFYIAGEIAHEAGLEIAGSGFRSGVRIRSKFSMGAGLAVQTTTTNTVGFNLQDSDVGDHLRVLVQNDPMYGTPVFTLEGGETSCPHESGSVPRDGISLGLDQYVLTGVDPGAAGTFELQMYNTSRTFERRPYEIYLLHENNPDAANVRVGGFEVAHPLLYSLPTGLTTTQMEVRRSEDGAYDYQNLKIAMRPECEEEEQIADTLTFSVHFTNPCSPLMLQAPPDNWIVNRLDHDSLEIIFNGYDTANLLSVSLQYTPSNQAAWETAFTIPAANLPGNMSTFNWNVSAIEDGHYDVRARLECDGGISYSTSASGLIDRSPPTVFGQPQPTDGILNIGEDISVTFNELIDSATVNAGNVQLIRVADGQIIPVDVNAFQNKVIITPMVQNQMIENHILQASVIDIADRQGNRLDEAVSWSFRVNRNPVFWNPSLISRSVVLGENSSFSVKIENHSIDEVNVGLHQLPAWLATGFSSEIIPADAFITVEFSLVDIGLTVGTLEDTVIFVTPEGYEPLLVRYDVHAEPPPWQLDPDGLDHNMTLTAAFYINDVSFSESDDIVAAFIGDSLRGMVEVQRVVPHDEYFAFLMVYNEVDQRDSVTFRIWDASEDQVRTIADKLVFVNDTIYGSIADPESLQVAGAVLQSIFLGDSWNLISLGLEALDMSPSALLDQLQAASGDVLKGHTSYTQFAPGLGWVGTLDTVRSGAGFKIMLDRVQILDFIGTPAPVERRPIEIESGWNWIGFLPLMPLPLDQALASVNLSDGDIIKSDTSFAQYDQGVWQGTLQLMRPGEGYLLNCETSSTLIYPGASGKQRSVASVFSARDWIQQAPDWTIVPQDFEFTMNITGTVAIDGIPVFNNNTLLAAFVLDECRGITRPDYVADKWMYFMTIYSNSEDEQIRFKIWDANDEQEKDIGQMLTFTADEILGSPVRPFEWHTGDPTSIAGFEIGIPDEFELYQNHPNPFNPVTCIRYALKTPENVKLVVYDMLGRVVSVLVDTRQKEGWYEVEIDGSKLASGLYFYGIKAGEFEKTHKMLLIK